MYTHRHHKHRCLMLPESSSKHVRIQAITSILATIIETDAPLDLDHVTPDVCVCVFTGVCVCVYWGVCVCLVGCVCVFSGVCVCV